MSMEIGQSAIQRGVRAQPGRNPVDMLKEGQIFSGKVMKLLPGQMAELAAFGQKMTAQIEVPLQAGERYFLQVASLERGVQLKVVLDNAPMQRIPEQAAILLEKLQLPVTKENVAFTALAIETGRPLSKDSIQLVSAWLSKAGLKDGMEALRFMFSRNLPVTENVFQALVSARSAESLTSRLEALQNTLVKLGDAPEATAAISRLLGESASAGKETIVQPADRNARAVQLAAALTTGSQNEKTAAIQTLQKALNIPVSTSSADMPQQLAAIVKNGRTVVATPSAVGSMLPVQLIKEALVQLAVQPVTSEATVAFKEAVSLSIPVRHPDRASIMQQVTQLTGQLTKDVPAANKQIASLFQLASSIAATVPEQAAARMAMLVGADARPFEEFQVPIPVNGKDVAAALKDAFRLLGIDHEAVITSKNQPEAMQQNVKQEMLKLMSETIPAPIREAAEQIVGRLNAQHILSAESGPLQQLVMQVPVQFAAFQGDVTIKWSGKKKPDGKVDADYCRVLFYVDMPNLKNTVIDMQVQNRIIHLNIIADAAPSSLKQMSMSTMNSLKESLEEQGYRLSGVQFKQPSEEEAARRHGTKPPLARIMDDEGYLGVDIRI
jgi:hypothetical protein